MKNYLLLFSSYFRQQFILMINVVIGFINFFVANFLAFYKGEDEQLSVFRMSFYAVFLLIPNLAVHLRSLAMSNANALLPNFRVKNIKLAFLYILILILFPNSYTHIPNASNLDVVIWLSFISSISIFIILKFKENLLLILAVIWIGVFTYGIMGLPTDIVFISYIKENYSFYGTNIILLITTVVLFGASYKVFMNLKIIDQKDDAEGNLWIKDFDKVSSKIEVIINSKLMDSKPKFSSVHKTAVMLFSPINTVFSKTVFIMAGYIFGLYSIIYFFEPDKIIFENGLQIILVALYFISAVILSTDFFQHRMNWTDLWITGLLKDRREQAKLMLRTYGAVITKSFIHQTIIYFAIYFIVKPNDLAEFIPIALMGYLMMLLIMGLSLLLNNDVISSEAKGWNVSFILIVLILITAAFISKVHIVFDQYLLLFIGFLSLLTIITLYNGYKNIVKSKLDYDFPGQSD